MNIRTRFVLGFLVNAGQVARFALRREDFFRDSLDRQHMQVREGGRLMNEKHAGTEEGPMRCMYVLHDIFTPASMGNTGCPICSCIWVGITDWKIPSSFPPTQPLLPNSLQPKLNQADSGISNSAPSQPNPGARGDRTPCAPRRVFPIVWTVIEFALSSKFFDS